MWFKVDDMFWAHPKTLGLASEPIALWVRAGCWSVQHLTDGFIPTQVVYMLGSTDAMLEDGTTLDMWRTLLVPAKALCLTGLWDEVDGGYQFHDWSDYQPSGYEVREARKAKSAARAEAGRRGAASRWNGKPDSKPDSKPVALRRQSDGPEPEPEPEPTARSKALVQRAVACTTAFDAFWSMYPRKIGKRTAQAAYERALKRATADDILAALQQQIPTWTDPQYIPHPTTWLNRDGWNDQPNQQSAPASLLSLAEDARRLEEGRRFFA